MPNTWEENAPTIEPIDKKVSRFMQTIVGDKYKFIESDVAKQMSLYRFLLKHRNVPIEDLYKSIKNESGKPMFTLNELRNIHNIVEKHKFNKFSQRLLNAQSGGVEKEYKDPRKNKFFDKLITKGFVSISSIFDKIIPPCIGIPDKWKNTLFSILFFLNTMENNKLFGPLISTGLDAIVLSLPVVISLVEEGAGKLIGLLPIPYASTAGDILVYACSIIVILFAVMLNISRRHFGEGFKVFLMVIPVFGDEIMTGTEQFEKGAESYMAKRERIVDAVGEISPSAAKIVNYWAPDVSTDVKPEPKYNLEAIKDDIVVYSKDAIQDTIGIDISTIKLDKIPSIGNLTKAVADGATKAASNGVAAASNSASNAANAVKNKNEDPSNANDANNNEKAANGEEANAEGANNNEKAANGEEANANDANANDANAEGANANDANAEGANNNEKAANGEDANANDANANDANSKEESSNKPNKVKKLKRGKGSRNVTKNAKKGGARKRTHKNPRRK